MRKLIALGLYVGVAMVGGMEQCIAAITSFDGFPIINYYQRGLPTYDGPLPSDLVNVPVRAKWTLAMSDVGGWPTMYEYQGDIHLEFNLVDGHRNRYVPGATGDLLRYRSSDQGNTWELLNSNVNGVRGLGEYAIKGDTLYRYEWSGSERRTLVSTSTDGVDFTPAQAAYESPFSMYGVMYDPRSDKFYAPPHYVPNTPDESQRQIHLIQSDNGIDWDYVSTIHGPGGAESETILHVRDDGSMVAMIRVKWGSKRYIMATSPEAPYTEWTSREMNVPLEGHQMFEVDGQLFVGSRAWLGPGLADEELFYVNAALGQGERIPYTIIYKVLDDMSLIPWAVLDSLGDNSYPRAVVTDDEVLFTYYSQHQDGVDKTYLAAFDKDFFLTGHAPEPSSFVLAGMGLGALGLIWRRRRTQRAGQ